MLDVIVQKSSNPNKNYDAVVDDKKKVSFDAKGYNDFSKYKDEERTEKCIARYKVN